MRAEPPLYCTEFGAPGARLVFLPGVGGTTRYWERRVAPLAETNRLVLVDLLGFGQSPKPWTTYTVERHVAALERVLGGRSPFTLVGHSFGAIAAVAYAAHHPDNVAGLVLIGLPYFGSEERAIGYYRGRHTLDGWFMTNVILASAACVVTRRLLGRALPYLLRDLPREVAEDIVQHTWRSSTSTIWDGIYRHDLALDTARLPARLPVLFLPGDQDQTAPLEGVHALVAILPNARLRVLPGVDHHPLLRQPESCLAEIEAFTNSRPVSAQASR